MGPAYGDTIPFVNLSLAAHINLYRRRPQAVPSVQSCRAAEETESILNFGATHDFVTVFGGAMDIYECD